MFKSVNRLSGFLIALVLLGIQGCAGDQDYGLTGDGEVWRQANFSTSELEELKARFEFSMVSVLNEKTNIDEPRLKIEFSFIMPSDWLYLQLPSHFLRKERLFDRIEDLSAHGQQAAIQSSKFEFMKILQSKKNERVKISYLVRPDDPNKAGKTDSFSAAIVRNDFFMFVGSMAVILPAGLAQDNHEFPVELKWHMPSNFEVFNSFGAKKDNQRIMASGADLWDSFYIGGSHIRSYEIQVNQKPVTVTIEGQFDKITDSEFVETIARLLKTQRDTWRDNNFPYFLVNFLALGDGCTRNVGHRFAGTAHRSSFRAFFPKDCELQPSMKQLISHELMHMWIGKKIKLGEERQHIDGKWLTEGWDDYYGRILAYRAGVITELEYFDTLNRALKDYQLSAERMAPLSKLVERMYKKPYTSQELEQLPYQQGELMAWNLNKKIKEFSNFTRSLDDVMRDLLWEADKAGGSKKFTPDQIAAAVDRYVPGVFSEEYKKIEDGKTPFLPPTLMRCSDPRTVNFVVINGRSYSIPKGIRAYTGPLLNQCDRWLK